MRSSVYLQGRYSANQEKCLHHFHRLITDHMRPHVEAASANGSGNGHVPSAAAGSAA
jgi:hypothetical protein